MAIIKCHECGNEVSSEANACPKCGAKPKKNLSGKEMVLGLILGIGVIGWLVSTENPQTPVQPTPRELVQAGDGVQNDMLSQFKRFCEEYDAQPNEILKSETYRKSLEILGYDSKNQINNWVGTLKSITTDQGGKTATLSIDIGESRIRVENIAIGTSIYNAARVMRENEKVIFSGVHLTDYNVTERGKVCDPNFKIELTSLSKYVAPESPKQTAAQTSLGQEVIAPNTPQDSYASLKPSAITKEQGCLEIAKAGMIAGAQEDMCNFKDGLKEELKRIYADDGCGNLVAKDDIDKAAKEILIGMENEYMQMGEKTFCNDAKESYDRDVKAINSVKSRSSQAQQAETADVQTHQEQPEQDEFERDKTENTLSVDTPQMMVMRMLDYALVDGGLSHESEIQQTKLQIESSPKPAKGNKKAARAINDKGLAASKDFDFNNAVKMFEEANKLDQSDIEIISNLGFAYVKQGNLDLAQQAINTALTMSPGRATAWASLGEVFGKIGDVNRAAACFSNTYRFSKDRLKTHQVMKKLNETEDVENIIQARAKAINWAEKSYPDISENTESKERITPEFNPNKNEAISRKVSDGLNQNETNVVNKVMSQDERNKCLLEKAKSGSYSSNDGGKSALLLMEACHAEWDAWMESCLKSKDSTEGGCNMTFGNLAMAAIKLNGK